MSQSQNSKQSRECGTLLRVCLEPSKRVLGVKSGSTSSCSLTVVIEHLNAVATETAVNASRRSVDVAGGCEEE